MCGSEPTPHGPLSGRSVAQRAARALEGFEGDDPREALPALRRKLRRLASDLRFEDAARLRDRITAVERVTERLDELARVRSLHACVVVPALEPGMVRVVFVSGGGLARRTVPRGGGAVHEIEAGLAAARRASASDLGVDATAVDELLLIASFLRRRPPELRVVALERDAVMAAVQGVALAA